ncbi:MAG: hypothetical protein Q4G43_06275 [Mobilicoccus sp.]|nr:hypothetical protein [Mobilicoccus sp.]
MTTQPPGEPDPDRPSGAHPAPDAGRGAAGRDDAEGGGTQSSFWPDGYTPGRADYICMTLLGVSVIYGLAIMLARPVLLGWNPLVLATLSGSRSALVTIGAQYGTGLTTFTVVIAAFVLSSLSIIKLDLLFWWAGRLWGDFFLKALVGDSKRKAKQAARAESLTRRWSIVAIIIANIPVLPVPRTIIFAVLGISGTSFRKILAVDLTAAAVVQAMWLYLGFTIGQPVVDVVEVIARYALWITLAIFVFLIVSGMVKARRSGAASGPPPESERESDTSGSSTTTAHLDEDPAPGRGLPERRD